MIRIERQLSAEPNPIPIPGTVTFRFDASSTKEGAAVDISYSIGERWDVCFETPSGPSKNLPHQATLGKAKSTVTKQARLVRCSGEEAAILRVTASVTEVSTGRSRRTACSIAPS